MRIKICGMSEQRRIDEAASLGVDFCGFVFHEKSPRNVTPSQVSLLDTHGMKRVGVFVNQRADEMREIIRIARLDYVQLHGERSAAAAGNFPAERVIRVLWPAQYATRDALEKDIARFAERAACIFWMRAWAAAGNWTGRLFAGFHFRIRGFFPADFRRRMWRGHWRSVRPTGWISIRNWKSLRA